MIQVEAEPWTLRVEGHGGGEPGRDILCAGVSAIAGALCGYCANYGGEARREHGRAQIVLPHTTEGLAVWRAAVIGLLQIEGDYPGDLSVAVIDTWARKGP